MRCTCVCVCVFRALEPHVILLIDDEDLIQPSFHEDFLEDYRNAKEDDDFDFPTPMDLNWIRLYSGTRIMPMTLKLDVPLVEYSDLLAVHPSSGKVPTKDASLHPPTVPNSLPCTLLLKKPFLFATLSVALESTSLNPSDCTEITTASWTV